MSKSLAELLARALGGAGERGAAPPEPATPEHLSLLRALSRMNDGVALIQSSKVLWANHVFAQMVGYALDEMASVEFDWDRVVLAEDEPSERSAGARTRARLQRKDGRVVHAEAAVEEVPGHPGRHVAVFRDVTSRRASERSLREQRDMYDALLQAQNNLEEGVVFLRDARIEFANDAFARICGRPLPELLSTEVDAEALLTPGGEERPWWILGEGTPAAVRQEATLRRPDGTLAHVEFSATAVTIRGEPYRLVLVRDVTRSKQDAEELAAARLRLARMEKFAALGSLVGGVAHEVRTPLTVIETSAQVLAGAARRARETGDYARLAELATEMMPAISGSVERANGLVKELRRFTQQEVTARGVLDLAAVVREAVDLYRAAHRGQAPLLVDLAPAPAMEGNPLQIQQIVINLLDNAAEAAGAQARPIRVATGAHEGHALLLVSDGGVGMDEATRRRIFEPLFTTKPNGTGLGLDIVKRIVDEHRGRIVCESAPGEGTTMRVLFPAAAPRAS